MRMILPLLGGDKGLTSEEPVKTPPWVPNIAHGVLVRLSISGKRGRDRISFNDSDFKCLSTWHLYCNGLISELPDNAVVLVGYTLGTYEGISRPIVSSNLQFIILLSACK